jgi:hypothetical protein
MSRPGSRCSRPMSRASLNDVAPSPGEPSRRQSVASRTDDETHSAKPANDNSQANDASHNTQLQTTEKNNERTTGSPSPRTRSQSAGIPSDRLHSQLNEPSTVTERRSRRSYSLERSGKKANAKQQDKKRHKQGSEMLDAAGGSSSMEDSEDGGVTSDKLKARFLAEIKERKKHEETAKLLQRNYDDLLRSHAEKELTIEQLRLGARVSLVCDPPTASHAETGVAAKPQRAMVFNVPKQGTAITASVVPQVAQLGSIAPLTGQLGSSTASGPLNGRRGSTLSLTGTTFSVSEPTVTAANSEPTVSRYGQLEARTDCSSPPQTIQAG